ncbi:hypothetical protein FH972_006746 [Carpinus fangiana]|uniref:Proteasome alpha-type subunits domain-containing protein n=1 Tax=Carpinus fangiana TaxID=176857 RepID=A0A5N6QWS5_9ROSI|nr:hypothetical protein FH972_006746 [Carpinus fangiana]
MATAGKRLALDKLDEAESPILRDIPSTYSEDRQEKLKSLRVMLRKEKYLLSSLWKKFPKLSSDWSERNSEPSLLIFDSIVDLVLNSNPVVAVVGKDEIILASHKRASYLGLDGCSLPLNGRNILAFAGLMEHARLLDERVDIEIAEYRRHYDVSHLIPISPELVALKVADVQYQLCHTKTGGGYPFFTFIAGFDIFTGQPELYAVDFTGRVGRFGAYAAGRGLELMNKFLRNNYQKEYYSARELAIRALLEVGEIANEDIELRVLTCMRNHDPLTCHHRPERVTRHEIDCIFANIETKKAAASKAPTHIRVVQEEREKTKKAAPKRAATEVESQVDESEAEKVASKAPTTHKRALEKEEQKAKKAIAEAATKEPSVDINISDKMNLPEEQVDEIEIREASETIHFPKVGVMSRVLEKMGAEKSASEDIPFGEFVILRTEVFDEMRRELENLRAEKTAAAAEAKAHRDEPFKPLLCKTMQR